MCSSEFGQEWAKIQVEMNEEREKNASLNAICDELKSTLNDKNAKLEQTSRDFDKFKQQFQLEKQKFISDNELRAKREELFKMLFGEFKEVVITVQKELNLQDIDWSMKGKDAAEKTKLIKEDLITIKKLIIEKLKNEKEELKVYKFSLYDS